MSADNMITRGIAHGIINDFHPVSEGGKTKRLRLIEDQTDDRFNVAVKVFSGLFKGILTKIYVWTGKYKAFKSEDGEQVILLNINSVAKRLNVQPDELDRLLRQQNALERLQEEAVVCKHSWDAFDAIQQAVMPEAKGASQWRSREMLHAIQQGIRLSKGHWQVKVDVPDSHITARLVDSDWQVQIGSARLSDDSSVSEEVTEVDESSDQIVIHPSGEARIGDVHIGQQWVDHLAAISSQTGMKQRHQWLQGALQQVVDAAVDGTKGNKTAYFEMHGVRFFARRDKGELQLHAIGDKLGKGANKTAYAAYSVFGQRVVFLKSRKHEDGSKADAAPHIIRARAADMQAEAKVLQDIYKGESGRLVGLPPAPHTVSTIQEGRLRRGVMLVEPFNAGDLHDACDTDGHPWDRMTTQQRMRMLAQPVQGLETMHAKGKAHGDIKPLNIFLATDPDGELVEMVLSDLGGACNMKRSTPDTFTDAYATYEDEFYETKSRYTKTERTEEINRARDVLAMSLSIIESLIIDDNLYDPDLGYVRLEPQDDEYEYYAGFNRRKLSARMQEKGIPQPVIDLLLTAIEPRGKDKGFKFPGESKKRAITATDLKDALLAHS